MVILVQRMGHSFIVWDKAATIRYKKPGKTDCFARFEVTDQELAAVRDEVNEKGRINWVRIVEIRDVAGDVVAEVEKTLYIATRAYYEAGRRAKEEEAARQKAALT